jgi:hypothetical protein
MLRVEATGPRPAVFPFLPVGYRDKTELLSDDSSDSTSDECKPRKSAMSLKETWPADNEVVLDGTPGPSVVTGEGLTLDHVADDGTIRPGNYRFTR